jgi:pyruvate,water dikinase
LRELVANRRAEWERQRRLVAPLTIGKPPRLLEKAIDTTVEAVRKTIRRPAGSIIGQPASPGRASGPVRLVRGPEDFSRFQSGDVLVARGTAPAWTPLFAQAAAVVTDGGSLAAHASLVAREYGIPAVVGTGDATVRLRDGQHVVVDGSAGVVEIASWAPRHACPEPSSSRVDCARSTISLIRRPPPDETSSRINSHNHVRRLVRQLDLRSCRRSRG